MRVFDLAFKDLSQVLRDKQSLLFLVVMPIVFTFFMGFAYRGTVQPQDPRLSLGWADADPGGQLSQQLRAVLETSEAVRLVEVDPTDAEVPVRNGEVAGALAIPADFSRKVMAGAPVQLTLVIGELGTTGQSLYQVLRAPITQLMSAVEIARLSVAALDAQHAFADEAARAAEQGTAVDSAAQAWATANRQEVWLRLEKAVMRETNTEARGALLGGNPYNQSSPGILVQFAIFGLVTSAQILVMERKTRTLQRLITTAMKPWQIIAGHLLAMFILGVVQTLLLIVFGQLVLGVGYFREPVGTLLVAVALSLWVANLGLFIGVLAKVEEQVVLFSLIAMFVFTSLGGAWFPLEGAGKAFSTIGHFTPAAWAMDGFQNILVRGLGLASVWLPVGILLAYALGFFALAVWRFQASEER